MLVTYLGDQSVYTGLIFKMGVTWVRMGMYEAKTIRLRRTLNTKLPCRRLCIDGENYVH